MPKPIFFVDGQTEQKVVQALCKDVPVQITGLNGKSATISAIAKKLSALIKLRGGKNYPIVILIDREQRKETVNKIVTELRDALIAEKLGHEDLRIGVADRMFENWILADLIPVTHRNYNNPDGVHGTGEIKKLRRTYSKTTDGVNLFLKADPALIYSKSPSFKHFIDQLNGIDCHYLRFKEQG